MYIPPSSFVHRHVAQVENDGERYHCLDKTTALRWVALDRLNSSNLRDVVEWSLPHGPALRLTS